MGLAAKANAEASIAAPLDVAPDIDARLAKFKPIEMPFNRAGLSEREQKLVGKLVDAANRMEQIYWRQSDPEGLKLYVRLEKSADPLDKKVLQFMKINGSRYDLIDQLRPFVGKEPVPPGRALYPRGLTQTEIEKYVAAHPEQKAEIYNEHSILLRDESKMAAVPYHLSFAELLKPAAEDLREAAKLSDDPAFVKFLNLRADALLNDDYYASDLAWLDMKEPKFDLILAPYESYLDNLLGVRTSYGAAVLVRNEEESKKLAIFQKYVADLQEALPLAKADLPSKRGHVTPMEVMDAPFRTGDLARLSIGGDLPNDARVHEAKGSKKIFFKNFMDARVNEVILPIARRLLREDQSGRASGNGYLAATLAHEISHELGPNYSRIAGSKKDIREAIGGDFSALEEAKADVVGLFCLKPACGSRYDFHEQLTRITFRTLREIFAPFDLALRTAWSRQRMEFNRDGARGGDLRRSDRTLRRSAGKNARRNQRSGKGIVGAGSHRGPRSYRRVVCKVCGSAGPSEAGIQPGLGHSSRHTTEIFVPGGDTMNEQNFSNHGKFVPMFHFFVIPVLIANVIWNIVSASRILGHSAAIGASLLAAVAFSILVSIALLLLAFLARLFALGVQDRVIRLEERMRYEDCCPTILVRALANSRSISWFRCVLPATRSFLRWREKSWTAR